jgi:hypothetical protein
MSPTLRGFLGGLLVGFLGAVLAVVVLGGPRIPQYADRPLLPTYDPPTLKRGPDVPLGAPPGADRPGDEPATSGAPSMDDVATAEGAGDGAPDSEVPFDERAEGLGVEGSPEDIDYALFEGTLVAYRAAGARDRHVAAPGWSLNGQYLTFISTKEGGKWHLRVREVTYPSFGEVGRYRFPGDGPRRPFPPLAWHRDGIFVVSVQGDDATRLYFAAPGGASAAEMLPPTKAPGNLTDPVLHPAGDHLAFASDAAGQQDVLQWDRRTDALDVLAGAPEPEYAPAYSPDGRRIAWARELPGGSLVLWKPLAGGEAEEVAYVPGERIRPQWVDDASLAWYRGAGRQWTLEVLDLEGEQLRSIPEARLPVDRRVAVLPGAVLAYAGNEPAQDRVVMLLRPEWPHPVGVSTPQYAVGEPALVRYRGRVLVAYTGLDTPESRWRALFVADITHAVESPGPPEL